MNCAAEVVDADLGYICKGLAAEMSGMSGKNLLIVGGAGFLGFYLVQSVLHWNATSGRPPIRLTVFDNFIRGRPDWLERARSGPHLLVRQHDVTCPIPDDLPGYSYIIHAASIASPSFYRMHPIETMDANVNGLRVLLDYSRDRQTRGEPVEGFAESLAREIPWDVLLLFGLGQVNGVL